MICIVVKDPIQDPQDWLFSVGSAHIRITTQGREASAESTLKSLNGFVRVAPAQLLEGAEMKYGVSGMDGVLVLVENTIELNSIFVSARSPTDCGAKHHTGKTSQRDC